MLKYDKIADPIARELRHKRDLVKERIKARVDKGRDAKNLIKEYYELTDKLYELGFTVPAKADYMTLSYWNMTINDLKPITSNRLKTELSCEKIIKQEKPKKLHSSQNTHETTEIKINIESKQSYYIFNLAWTEVESKDLDKMLKLIQRYFEIMQLKETNREQNINIYTKEYIIQYELQCDSKVFDIICKSAQFIIDELSTELTSRNIAIYGNKKEIN